MREQEEETIIQFPLVILKYILLMLHHVLMRQHESGFERRRQVILGFIIILLLLIVSFPPDNLNQDTLDTCDTGIHVSNGESCLFSTPLSLMSVLMTIWLKS